MKAIRLVFFASIVATGCHSDHKAIPSSPPSNPAPLRAAGDYDYKAASMVTYRGLSAWISRIDRDGERLLIVYNLRAEDDCDWWLNPAAWCIVTFLDVDGTPIGDLQGKQLVMDTDLLHSKSGMQRTMTVTPPKGARAVRTQLGCEELTTKPCQIPTPDQLQN